VSGDFLFCLEEGYRKFYFYIYVRGKNNGKLAKMKSVLLEDKIPVVFESHLIG
jgi:hypothetical protein